MSTKIWMPWYIADYERDTKSLSLEEDCIYRRALDYLWENPAGLPWDTQRVCRCLRITEQELKNTRWVLDHYLQGDGIVYTSNRLSEEKEKANQRSGIAKENGKKGGRPLSYKKPSGLAKHNPEHNPENNLNITQNESSSPSPSPSPSPSQSPADLDSCAEPQGVSTPKFIEIPVLGKKLHLVFEADVVEYQDAYPAVDVRQQFRSMKQWCITHPERQKTPKGIRKFINGWLAREQDRGGIKQKGENHGTIGKNFGESRDQLRQQRNEQVIDQYLAKESSTDER